jgi:hypothetical protein
MRAHAVAAAVAAIALVAFAGCTHHPSTTSFAWEGTPGDAWVRIRNLDGRVEVRRSPDERVVVAASVKTGGRSVAWVRDSSDEAITFCVVFDGARRDCDNLRGGGSSGLRAWARRKLAGGGRQRASVQYTLYVPASARLDVRTVNGAIDVQSVARELRARTVNGKVTAVAVASAVDVETVNGSIDARLELDGDGDVHLSTVNGSVMAELPASIDGDVRLSTVNGSATSDFALQGEGRKSRHGMLGAGGRDIEIKAVNGSVKLRRRG